MTVGRGEGVGGAPTGRLTPGPACRVDFSRPLAFRFLGRPMTGFAGDTVASALYANGVRIFGRSLKYHRPRGLYSLDGESSNALMEIDGVPNECAETTALRVGMSIRAQNVRGDPRTDRFAFLDAFDRLMPAGFYYRLFHRPYRLWPLFQKGLRRMAGTGVLDPVARPGPDVRAERYLNADVAVVGGGQAGMAAALAAAESGLRVCLFERRGWLGGHLAWRVREYEGEPQYERAEGLARRLSAGETAAPATHPAPAMHPARATHPAPAIVKVFTNSPVTGVWGENLVTGFTVGGEGDPFRECHLECRAKAVVVAAGCMERPLVFNHNDRPGVMQAGTAWRLARTYGVKPGNAVVFSVADDLSLEAAVDLADLGVPVQAVADAREAGHQDPALGAALEERGIPFLPGWAASRALGRKRVTGCELRTLRGAGSRRLRCDLLVANAGWQPGIGALATAGARLAYCTHTHTFQPVQLPRGVFAAGSLTGLRDPRSIEASGRLAGCRAAEWCLGEAARGGRWNRGGAESRGAATVAARATEAAERNAESLPGPEPGCDILHGPGIRRGAKAFVDLDEDGTWKNVVESAAQGFDVPELAKRFGGFGLGPGQYRVTGQNLAMIMADLRGDPLENASPTTVRPPLVAPSLATLAGPGHDVHKRTPLHGELASRGAVFRRAGPWLRARHFGGDPRHGASEATAHRLREEILNVRRNVGLLDSSPLGKFRIFGPDALNALQRVYISDISRARPGRCLYSALCNDMAHVLDDGAIVMDNGREYYFTTSSARAGSTMEWFRYHTRHDGWDFHLVNVTDVFGSINLAGPNARRVLERVTDDDISNEAFPYMGCRWITVGDVEVRCLRLGFVGELSYELHVPSSYCQFVWDLLVAAGADFGIQPFGLEAQYCLRAEKGHIIVGAESEARVTLTDIGMGWLWDREDTVSKKVGAPALRACEGQPGRLKLVGLRVRQGAGSSRAEPGASGAGPGSPRDGALVLDRGEIVGHVCTTRYSDTLGWQYGMALVREEVAVKGGRVVLQEEDAPGTKVICMATIVSPPFYDPGGERLRA